MFRELAHVQQRTPARSLQRRMRWANQQLEQNIECRAEVTKTLALSPSPAEYQVRDPNGDRHEAEYDWPIHPTVSPLRVRSDCA